LMVRLFPRKIKEHSLMVSDDQGAKRVDAKQCCNCRIWSGHIVTGSSTKTLM